MEILIGLLLLWILPSCVLWGVLSSGWLNARGDAVASFACKLFVGVLFSTLLACGLLVVSDWSVATLGIGPDGILGARLDALSGSVLLLIAFLGLVILRFSRNYLAGDERQGHFTKWMVMTLGSVMTLTVAPGLGQFLLGWMATSFGLHRLLVYFPDRQGTLLSARKKAVVSQLGNVCLIAAFFGIYKHFGTQDFGTLFVMVDGGVASITGISWAAWLIALGALLKSAQFPFHTWLPDTMGAPTPVSALMHAGIINGGGYLIIRLSPLIVSVPGALGLLAIVGMLTAIYAAMVMLTQTSVKRALAYSTIAQMGFMMLQCGLGAFHLAALHIIAHSLYKAHTFLSSGTAVETAQKLNADPATLSLPQNKIWVALVPSLSIVIVLSLIFGLNPENKPGMLVLSLVVVMALTHWLWVQMRRGVKGGAWLSALTRAAFYGALYFALARAADWLLEGVAPDTRAVSLGFELLMVLLLAVFLLTSIRFQDGEPGFLSVAYKRKLYVHALNGFYMNTLVNRIARKLGLVPGGR
jgi:NAD(P)H-quinone oxidoreductase subunit 5